MLYFAYGSNMDPVQMAKRCPGAPVLGAARLPDHRLTFTYDSGAWGGGVGNVVPAPGEEVWGVLWDLDDEHVRTLDRYEGVAQDIYRRVQTAVIRDGEPVEAMIYLCRDAGYKRPSRRYVRALVRGALAHGVPQAYVDGLEALVQRQETR